jgi:hypothetical protein
MKSLLLAILGIGLVAFGLAGCAQQGQKVGYVNCCVKQSDGSKKCVSLPQGECKNTPGATIVTNCTDCK